MIHIWLRPYKKDFLNAWDAIILLVAMLVVNSNAFTFLSSATTELIVILVLFPIFLCFLIAVRKVNRVCVMRQKVLPAYDHIEEIDQSLLSNDIQLRFVMNCLCSQSILISYHIAS